MNYDENSGNTTVDDSGERRTYGMIGETTHTWVISKFPLLILLLIGTVFLMLSGYASLKRDDGDSSSLQDQFDVTTYGKRMVDYLSSFASKAPSPVQFATLMQKDSSQDYGVRFTPKSSINESQLNFPESYNSYILLYDNTVPNEHELLTSAPQNEAQIDKIQVQSAAPATTERLSMPKATTPSEAEMFAQNLQKQRYNQLINALAASSSVSSSTGANALSGGGSSAKSQLISLSSAPGTGTNPGQSAITPGYQGFPGMNSPYGNAGFAGTSGLNGLGQGGFAQGGFGGNGIAGTAGRRIGGSGAWMGMPAGNGNPRTGVDLQTGLSSAQTLAAYQGLVNPNTTLSTHLEPVLSPFLLRQGAVLPCVLLTGVNSDLPGLIQAQLTQDVFDSPTGQNLLMPKGSKIIGQYASSPKMGQQRLILAFNRVIFPNGVAMNLGAQPGSSLDGYSGFDAQVDNHFWQLMGNAILLGGITAGISISVDDRYDDDGDLTVNGALSQGLGQSIGRVLTQVIERNLVVSPTLKVKPGLEFNVTLTQDIYFERPYA